MTVPVMRPRLPDPVRVAPRLRSVQESGLFSNFGPQVTELESCYAAWLGVSAEQVVSASNATLALAGAVAVTGRPDWSVPSFTFTASVAAALLAGTRVTFRDIDPDSWWLDPGGIGDHEAAIAVAPFGAAVDLDRYAGREDVVIDAAASLGTRPDLRDLPASWSVVFSLHATKVLGAGEGGIAVFGDAERAQRFRMWTNFGFFGTRESRLAGVNAKMSEIQAAYAITALDGWDQERAEWTAARDLVVATGDGLGMSTFAASRGGITPYWIVALPDATVTDRIEWVLAEHGIGTRRWWSLGCHTMPGYRAVPRADLRTTEDVASRYLGLPLYRGLGMRDAERVGAALQAAVQP